MGAGQWGVEIGQMSVEEQNVVRTSLAKMGKVVFHGTEENKSVVPSFVKIDGAVEITNFKMRESQDKFKCHRTLGLKELMKLIDHRQFLLLDDELIPSKLMVAISLNDATGPMSFNGVMYNFLVDQSLTALAKAAKDRGLSFQVNRQASISDYINFYTDPFAERLIFLAHGSQYDANIFGPSPVGSFYDSISQSVMSNENFQLKNRVKKGKRLSIIDIVACSQYELASDWTEAFGVEARVYSQPHDKDHQGGVIFWNQTNEVLNKVIPQSILSGKDNSGLPPVVPDAFTAWFTSNFY